jgi:ADP-ribose pyrophosphatase
MKIRDRKTQWQGKFLRSVLLTYEQAAAPGEAGKMHQWEYVERIGCNCIVGVVAITDDESVIVARQFRPPLGGYVVELPAGLCEPNEPPEDAAKRELIEETGYSASELHFLAEGPLSSGLSSEILTAYLATGLSYVGIGDRDETEDIEVMKIPVDSLFEKLEELRTAGNYIDLKIYGLVSIAKKFI